MRSPKAKKAAKTRAKNARLRANKAKERSAAALTEQAALSKRAKAYADMEPHLCDLVRMGEIAAMMFDKDEGLFIFATTHLDEMLQEFRRRYHAMDFQP
jgi:hypothetical protein